MPQFTVPLGIVDVTVHADPQGQGYQIYSTVGKRVFGRNLYFTGQKQYVGRDGGCITLGTVNLAGSHAQVQGCLKVNPARFEGKAEACFLKKCTSKNFSFNV